MSYEQDCKFVYEFSMAVGDKNYAAIHDITEEYSKDNQHDISVHLYHITEILEYSFHTDNEHIYVWRYFSGPYDSEIKDCLVAKNSLENKGYILKWKTKYDAVSMINDMVLKISAK